MEIKGRLVKIMPPMTGMGRNGEWKKQEFVIELEGTYPKKVCISTWGDKVNIEDLIGRSIMVEGAMLKVFFDIESREYQDKWFTNLTAWKIEPAEETHQAPPMPPIEVYQPDVDMPPGMKDDLPF